MDLAVRFHANRRAPFCGSDAGQYPTARAGDDEIMAANQAALSSPARKRAAAFLLRRMTTGWSRLLKRSR